MLGRDRERCATSVSSLQQTAGAASAYNTCPQVGTMHCPSAESSEFSIHMSEPVT